MSRMTETWREGRKLVDRSLRPGAIVSYRQMMQEKTREFLAELYSNPKNFHNLLKLLVGHLPYIVRLLMTR
jgi:cytochrome P450